MVSGLANVTEVIEMESTQAKRLPMFTWSTIQMRFIAVGKHDVTSGQIA